MCKPRRPVSHYDNLFPLPLGKKHNNKKHEKNNNTCKPRRPVSLYNKLFPLLQAKSNDM